MQRICVLIGLFAAMLIAGPVAAQHASGDYGASYGGGARTVAVERWVEEWDPASGRWVRVSDDDAATTPATIPSSISGDAQVPVVTTAFVGGVTVTETRSAARYAVPIAPRAPAAMLGQYGPFVVTSPTSAALTGPTDDASPFLFDAMLRDEDFLNEIKKRNMRYDPLTGDQVSAFVGKSMQHSKDTIAAVKTYYERLTSDK